MSDSQIVIPPSFIALFIPEGKTRPMESRETIAQRYDLCEDMAQMLTDTAREKHFGIGVDESEVLDRIHAGLKAEPVLVTDGEALWIIRRLAELMGWKNGDAPH